MKALTATWPATMSAGNLLTTVALAALLGAEYYENKNLVWVFKPLASTGFLLAALQGSRSNRTLFAGLCFAMVGDIFLIPDAEWAFQAGLGSFLLGHVFYAIALTQQRFDPLVAGVTIAPLAGIAAFVYNVLAPHVPADLQIPVMAYMAIITFMVAAAAATRNTTAIIGALLFYVSDLLVAREQFLAPGFVNKAIGLPLYYVAQLVRASLFH